MSRLTTLSPEAMSEAQRAVYKAIASGPRGGVRGPLAIWLHSPGLAERAQALGEFCRYHTSLPPRLSELAILVIATVWGSEYEWFAHKPLALKAGVAPAVVEALRSGQTPVFEAPDEAAVYDILTSLHRTRRIDAALYARAEAVLGSVGLVELVGIAGYYTLISMTINLFEVGLPDGVAAELRSAG